MCRKVLLLIAIIILVKADTLLDRFVRYQLEHKPFHHHNGILDYSHQLHDDSFIPLKSIHQIAYFRGKPILSRQNHVFIDDNGIPVPLPKTFINKFPSET